MPDPIGFNPAETDATADDYITPITTLPDTSFVLIPKADPNNAGKTIYEKITVANLKAALAPNVWVGTRRQIKASGQQSTSGGVGSVLTNSIVPSRSGALIRVRVGLFASLTTAPGANAHIHFFAKRKVGTGSYTGMDGGGSYSQFAGHIDVGVNYIDWVQPGAHYEWIFEAASTETIKVNTFVRARVGNSDQSNYVLNRNTNNTLDGEMVSFLEIAEFKKSESANPLTITTITSVDSD